jgi:hypothetical protein
MHFAHVRGVRLRIFYATASTIINRPVCYVAIVILILIYSPYPSIRRRFDVLTSLSTPHPPTFPTTLPHVPHFAQDRNAAVVFRALSAVAQREETISAFFEGLTPDAADVLMK